MNSVTKIWTIFGRIQCRRFEVSAVFSIVVGIFSEEFDEKEKSKQLMVRGEKVLEEVWLKLFSDEREVDNIKGNEDFKWLPCSQRMYLAPLLALPMLMSKKANEDLLWIRMFSRLVPNEREFDNEDFRSCCNRVTRSQDQEKFLKNMMQSKTKMKSCQRTRLLLGCDDRAKISEPKGGDEDGPNSMGDNNDKEINSDENGSDELKREQEIHGVAKVGQPTSKILCNAWNAKVNHSMSGHTWWWDRKNQMPWRVFFAKFLQNQALWWIGIWLQTFLEKINSVRWFSYHFDHAEPKQFEKSLFLDNRQRCWNRSWAKRGESPSYSCSQMAPHVFNESQWHSFLSSF